jgi:hypothetical protein
MATLFDLAQTYLNQALPSIDPIFSNTGIASIQPTAAATVAQPVQPVQVGLTPEQLRLLYPQGDGEGGGGNLGGKFGNLDLSKSKMFTKDVYDEELGDFIPTELEAFYNPRLGMYQTYEGKNINPMFSNTGVTFGLGGALLNFMGMQPKTVGGFIPGSIRGFYDSPKDLIKKNKNIQQQTAQQKADIQRVQNRIAGGDFNRSDKPNRNASKATKSAASKSSGVGVGGYTKQDSARESYRGRY